MRRIRSESLQNLDSLTDTLTNVVGFMIVATLVTQISVGDAVKKSLRAKAPLPPVSPEALAEAKREQAHLTKLLAELTARWGPLQPKASQNSVELARLRAAIAALEKEAASPGSLAKSRGQLDAQLAELQSKLATLERQITEALAQQADLQQQLAKAPPPVAGPKTVRIPVVHDAPPGMQWDSWFCRRGRVYPCDQEGLEKKLVAASKAALNLPAGQAKVTLGPGDGKRLADYLDRHDVGDNYFRIKLEDFGFVLLVDFQPRRDDQGETLEQIHQPDSTFQKSVHALNTRKSVLRFLVWADSFDTYLEARSLAEQVHTHNNVTSLMAGWTPFSVDEGFRLLIGGGGGGGPSGPRPD